MIIITKGIQARRAITELDKAVAMARADLTPEQQLILNQASAILAMIGDAE